MFTPFSSKITVIHARRICGMQILILPFFGARFCVKNCPNTRLGRKSLRAMCAQTMHPQSMDAIQKNMFRCIISDQSLLLL